jgi:hypothetical protein
MLRRLEPIGNYRSLTKGFWPNGLPLGRRSVIYGHNGSGKSSFASLLLERSCGRTSLGRDIPSVSDRAGPRLPLPFLRRSGSNGIFHNSSTELPHPPS